MDPVMTEYEFSKSLKITYYKIYCNPTAKYFVKLII